jgi:subtilisin family serine protease
MDEVIFILRPKVIRYAQLADLSSTRFDQEHRKKQFDQLQEWRRSDVIDQEIRRWLGDQKGQDRKGQSVAVLSTTQASAQAESGITASTVVRMTAERAQEVQKEFGERIMVIQDRPLELIKPYSAGGAAPDRPKQKLNRQDFWHLEAIGLLDAQSRKYKYKGDGIGVAVLDTGIDGTHPDLTDRMAMSYGLNVGDWSVAQLPEHEDTEGHGTHVAGLIAGAQTGVAPGVSLTNVVMLPNGMGNLSDFLLALEWVAQQPAIQIVNMSAGLRGYLPEMREAVSTLLSVGVLPVFAIGNEGRNRTRSPGNYNESLSVGATTRSNRVAAFSGGGRLLIDNHLYYQPDVVAPGEDVYSCNRGGGYVKKSGSSMAAPIVAGVAALRLEENPSISVVDLTDELFRFASSLGEEPERQGYGMVQVIR